MKLFRSALGLIGLGMLTTLTYCNLPNEDVEPSLDESEELEEGTTVSGLRKDLGGTNGQGDYCVGTVPCVDFEGDCDTAAQCSGGTVCGADLGPNYNMPRGHDVCVPAACNDGVQNGGETGVDCGGPCAGTCTGATCATGASPGDFDWCVKACPCGTQGDGDCDTDVDCRGGDLICKQNVGASFGFAADWDVCVASHCGNGTQDNDETGRDCGGADCGACTTMGGGNAIGCADGAREGFISQTTFPNIAGCSGAFSVPGLGATTPACSRRGGDDGLNPTGTGCNIQDMCAVGWHVCSTAAEYRSDSNNAACTAGVPATPQLFFLQRQSGPGPNVCSTGNNDVFGCGNFGSTGVGTSATCMPLNRSSGNLCSSIGNTNWDCNDGTNVQEGLTIFKRTSSQGGVLCCRD